MKVIHVPFCFAPDPVGGTEIFVAHIARDLKALGVDVLIAAPNQKDRNYAIDGLPVRRFAMAAKVTNLADLYGAGDSVAAARFEKILDEEKPQVVHVHAFTAAVSLKLVREAKRRNIAVVFTYHTPTVTCQRGTLRLYGKAICDGEMKVKRCTACTLQGLGVNRFTAMAAGALPPVFGRSLGKLGLHGGLWTALRYSELMDMRHKTVRQMTSEVDHIVAVCNWVRDILVINGVPLEKISVSRQGISWDERAGLSETAAERDADWLRFAFVGRFDSTKGLDTVIDAFRMTPNLKIKLDVYGVVQSPANAKYRVEMAARCASDPRITFKEPLPPHQVVARLHHYNFLVIPSRWLETGPMVALEAFAAGIPVLGSNLGGIAEIVRDGVDGLLVEQGSVKQWTDVFRRLIVDHSLQATLKAGVRPPRRSIDAAREMLVLYNSLVERSGMRPGESISRS
jgi:glycosyltransferase involved in cell wall biosynthesis